MKQWILTYIASYLEDIADATLGRNFGQPDAILLGMAGASVIKNIVDRFQHLAPAEREQLIADLKGEWLPAPVAPINEAGLALIKEFEGCRLEAYQCPAGMWTIGYGHTRGVAYGQSITQAQAEELLLQDVAQAANAVRNLVKVELNDDQLAALTSFVFNLGAKNLADSTLLRRLNEGDYECVPEQLERWVYAGGKKLPGLVRRRQAEAALFTKGEFVQTFVRSNA